jgi:hypothetical protein
MMEARHLASQIAAFAESDEQKWFPSLRRALQDVDAATASTPIPHGNSIWAVVNHISFWLDLARRRIVGEPTTLEEARESGWSLEASGTGADWDRCRADVARRAVELARIAGALRDDELDVEWAPGRARKWQVVSGVTNHLSFHIGEILTIRAALGKPLER